MPLYDPRLLPSGFAFEILVFLVLQQEQPHAQFERILPPDWGIDILGHTPKGIVAYQCKHYSAPQVSAIRRDIARSVVAACAYRDVTKWAHMVFCFSSDLSAPQAAAVREIALSHGLKDQDISIRGGSSFLYSIATAPLMWDIAIGASQTGEALVLGSDTGDPITDSRLRSVFARIRSTGSKAYISDLLADAGISRINALRDWYEIALPFYRSTQMLLRVMTFDNEIALFWLTKRGGPYLQMNLELLANHVEVRRLFVFDFAIQEQNPLAFATFLAYAASQESIGISCRIIAAEVFSAEAPLECEIFCVQDRNNVMLYAPRDLSVVFSKDNSTIATAAEAFDELFNHVTAEEPIALLARCRNIPPET